MCTADAEASQPVIWAAVALAREAVCVAVGGMNGGFAKAAPWVAAAVVAETSAVASLAAVSWWRQYGGGGGGRGRGGFGPRWWRRRRQSSAAAHDDTFGAGGGADSCKFGAGGAAPDMGYGGGDDGDGRGRSTQVTIPKGMAGATFIGPGGFAYRKIRLDSKASIHRRCDRALEVFITIPRNSARDPDGAIFQQSVKEHSGGPGGCGGGGGWRRRCPLSSQGSIYNRIRSNSMLSRKETFENSMTLPNKIHFSCYMKT